MWPWLLTWLSLTQLPLEWTQAHKSRVVHAYPSETQLKRGTIFWLWHAESQQYIRTWQPKFAKALDPNGKRAKDPPKVLQLPMGTRVSEVLQRCRPAAGRFSVYASDSPLSKAMRAFIAQLGGWPVPWHDQNDYPYMLRLTRWALFVSALHRDPDLVHADDFMYRVHRFGILMGHSFASEEFQTWRDWWQASHAQNDFDRALALT